MKLVLFDEYVPGLLVEHGVIDQSKVVGDDIMSKPGPSRMTAIIEQWDRLHEAIAKGGTGPAHRDYRLRAPLPQPKKMLFAAGNYNEGISGGHSVPIDMFLKTPSSILDPNGIIVLPAHDAQLFFHEAELGVVIGIPAKHVSEHDAMAHVFGYTCVNDVSSFGLPGATGGMRNKNFDTFCPIGPCIVTKDEIADPHALHIQLWIDDVLRQDYVTDDMEHRIPALLSWASQIVTLQPGDLLSCGTNHGGIGPIQNGDKIRLGIRGIGEIVNTVQDDLVRRWPVGADPQFAAWMHRFKHTGETSGPLFSVYKIDAG